MNATLHNVLHSVRESMANSGVVNDVIVKVVKDVIDDEIRRQMADLQLRLQDRKAEYLATTFPDLDALVERKYFKSRPVA